MTYGALVFTSIRGVKSHISADANNCTTICGEWNPNGFLGELNDEQKEKAQSLPLCLTCSRKFAGKAHK